MMYDARVEGERRAHKSGRRESLPAGHDDQLSEDAVGLGKRTIRFAC